MRKLLITNIMIGSLFGVFAAFAIDNFMYMYKMILLMSFEWPFEPVPLLEADEYKSGLSDITLQIIIGFVLSIPVMVVMWKQTKKINDKSILFLGAPIISIFASLFYYSINSVLWDYMYKEAPYILLAFVLFYSLLQLAMYYIVKTKQKV